MTSSGSSWTRSAAFIIIACPHLRVSRIIIMTCYCYDVQVVVVIVISRMIMTVTVAVAFPQVICFNYYIIYHPYSSSTLK